MINELQEMVGTGALKIVPDSAVPVAFDTLANRGLRLRRRRLAAQSS